ncbi:hypothetical protein OIE67_16005 [Nonomuraea fuscirosea]|uniref:type II toxin-antitoxin system Phd/YefM family antitoxin n=1 Tax=Nonomuraea fuscirosea TaxID=1291556 RepID=UPI002DD91DE2|nr:hypothetical protein [Nonomuraea fuscirosea]WSA56049.1 hypothetical protein OIE67_16005 [Nonomuraea fuscirosea]
MFPMAHNDSAAAGDVTAPSATQDAAEVAPPAERELGIREARGQLGELADRARYLDEITYLTKHRTRIAAVVPAEAARTRAQLADTVEQSLAEAERTRRDYERLHRAADAVLEAREVLWARAHQRVWTVLDHLSAYTWKCTSTYRPTCRGEAGQGTFDELSPGSAGDRFPWLRLRSTEYDPGLALVSRRPSGVEAESAAG